MKQIYFKIVFLLVTIMGMYILFHNIFANDVESLILDVSNVQTKEPAKIQVSLTREGVQSNIELEAYLIGVVASEMPSSFELEALKAQAVAARTFVAQRGYQVDDTTSSQVYYSNEELQEIHEEGYFEMIEKITQAVQETHGEVLVYDNKYISALFYSSSGGMSNCSQDYFVSEQAYLQSVPSPWDLQFESTTQSINIPLDDFYAALQLEGGVITHLERYDSGYVKEVHIGSGVYSGREIREALTLRSSNFDISISDQVYITTYGYGHGVGMSQYGAQGMALQGSTYRDILTHYYSGVDIINLYE